MAYLVRIVYPECWVCGKNATVTLYDKRNCKVGDYCKYHGDMMRIDLKATEYYEVD